MKRNSVTLDPITKKFTQINPPEKLPKVELTEEDEERVVKQFRDIFNRDPSPDELLELYIEERKIKQEHLNNGSSQR